MVTNVLSVRGASWQGVGALGMDWLSLIYLLTCE